MLITQSKEVGEVKEKNAQGNVGDHSCHDGCCQSEDSCSDDCCADDSCHDDCCADDSCNDGCCDCEAGNIKKPVIITGVAFFIAGLILAYVDAISFPGIFWVQLGIFIVAYLIIGWTVVSTAVKNIFKGEIFDENFLMTVASLGAFIIGEQPEAVAVMLFYRVGEYFQDRAISKSKTSIRALLDIRPDTANLVQGDRIIEVKAETVEIGSIISVKPGERIPLDSCVIKGKSNLDLAALTGESKPVEISEGDDAPAGAVNGQGLITLRVTKGFKESTANRIVELVENAESKKANVESFITRFAKYYTPAVCAAAFLLAVLPPLFGLGTFSEWAYRGLVFLVVSCPCALVISIPLGFFGGIGSASTKGILVKGGNYLDALATIDTAVFDKTGTLTEGSFKVTSLVPANGLNESDLLKYAAIAESSSTHPIGRSIIAKFQEQGGSLEEILNWEIVEKPGLGISASLNEQNVIVGNMKLLIEEGIDISNLTIDPSQHGSVQVAVDGKYAGMIVIEDSVRSDSKEAISGLRDRGVNNIVMLTGDVKEVAEMVAGPLGITDVRANLFPWQKVEVVEEIIEAEEAKVSNPKKRGKVMFLGDGINDAPVLARADIGVAMGGLGADAAIEAADVVLMNDSPSKLLLAIDIARKTKRIVWQNIGFALGVKAIVLILTAFGISTMWEAVFADVGVALLATLNALRARRV